ncbi:hypothetical protein GDO81_004024 [Engystomops pustulosus]|uniref:RRM domain-containing protein n=3 Tax=Engystomops pustulosus TaxID=76066 RepID=A0AAV6ZPY7_ENGPU|nr:hypothetical protein GDO81_004024 [Engystomops pustulosus]KAG8551243.1 hypothetical protein GDO81_004024 [Engystomops pustulosus]
MAARWGTGEETLTIGGMELFTAGGPLQCHDLEEDETCDGLSDLTLSSLDAGGLLGSFQGYIDNSIISIIDDPGAQAEHKDPFDENELSLLNALTEILDNADDENMSPFDTIPDTELLVSPRDRDGSTKLLCLSRTPPDHEMFSVDAQRRAASSKMDGRCSGPNWDLFPDTISSTPKRRSRHKSLRGCLPRRAETEATQQRSDGEDEEVPSPGDVADKNSSVIALDRNVDTDADNNDGDQEQLLMQGTPCIINTENVALNDLVKYMHPYCLPSITMCLESEDDDNLLSDTVYLEIVSDQGECIKVPVVVEPPPEVLCTESLDGIEGMDLDGDNLPEPPSSSEQGVPEMENTNKMDCTDKPDEKNKAMEEKSESLPELEELSSQPPAADVKCLNVDDNFNSKENVQDCKKSSDPDTTRLATKEKAPLKGKRSKSKSKKSKSKAKIVTEDKSPDSPAPVQSITQPLTSRPSNPSLQESDFLIKTLDQVKKESQMELRSSKISRTKGRTRPSVDCSTAEKRMTEKTVKLVTKEIEQVVPPEVANVDKNLEPTPILEQPKSEESPDSSLKASETCGGEEQSSNGEAGASKVEDTQDGDSSDLTKEVKPKSLSLSEYRKRLQHRKPIPDRDNMSCSKWPTVPEPPTELAELPCLVVPAQSKKQSGEVSACPASKAANVPPQNLPVATTSVQTTLPPNPSISQEVRQPCPAVVEVAPPPMITPQPNMPPPFYPPVWPNVLPHPYYPGMPPPPAVPHYPDVMPPVMPVQPPPVMTWPSFPPPPIAVPPVHPAGWVSGPPMPFWPNPQMTLGMPEMPVPFSATSFPVPPDQKMLQEAIVQPNESRPQTAAPQIAQTNSMPVRKSENRVGQKVPKAAAKTEAIRPDKNLSPAHKAETSLAMKTTKKSQDVPPPDTKKANIPVADLKSANQVVIKIMEILKKAQKLGFQIKPSSSPSSSNTQPGVQVAPAPLKQMAQAEVKVQEVTNLPIQETPVHGEPATMEKPAAEKIPTMGGEPVHKVAEVKVEPTIIMSDKEKESSVFLPRAETLCTSEETSQTIAQSEQKEPEKSFACESGIEATDLTSLLEQFEQSEAKEERLPQNPDKLAVGNSGTGKTLEKKIHEKQLAPELLNTAGLTPPATPPHQLWKSVVAGPLAAKSKSLHGQEKTSSPLKTAKLIEAKPLPQSRLKNRNVVPSVALPPIHVASGDHDYCILSSQRAENKETSDASPAAPSRCEEGSRWNVKHHPNITIKPIVQFNKPQQSKACPKQPPPSAPSAVTNQSTTCGPIRPVAPCDSIQDNSRDPLDHRTNVMAKPAVSSPPGSVLMSPDSSPCRSENGQSRTDLKRGGAPVSRRALRCYRKYKGSPSPQKSSRRGRSSGSRSDSRSSSSSSSRSRSGSPASKRRRTSRYRSRSRHRSRSSSRSSYGSRRSSRSSSSCSSRSCSCSLSSSGSRSRSRSPYRRRYRSRSRRYESRESFNRRQMFHKERAIEERRVVYIGKINSQMTRSELRRRFSVFGDIEECTIHFREEGDNYGFVTYRCTREAFAAIENGHKLRLPDELPFDLCFGGRRQFCKSNYADLDSNCDDFDPAPVRSKFETLDFDTLLKQAQKNIRR